MLSRLPIALAQLKAGNNSDKLANEKRQLLHSLYISKKLNKSIYNNLINTIYKMETIFMNTENSKTNEPHRFRLTLADKLNLEDPNKNMALANSSIYCTWKNIKSAYNNNKFKISAPTLNDEFYLPDGSYSVSDIQDFFEYIIKKHETIADIPPAQIYTNKIKNRIVFKIKSCYKLELLSSETMRLLGSTKLMLITIRMEKMCQN